MYNLYIPIMNKKRTTQEEKNLFLQLEKVKPAIILLIVERCVANHEYLKNELKTLRENMILFEQNGFKTGVWVAPTLGYGYSKTFGDGKTCEKFHNIKSVTTGESLGGVFCPLDVDFTDEFCYMLKKIAECGVDLILLEDDFNYDGHLPGFIGCCCDLHMKEYKKVFGASVDIDVLRENIFKGEKNKYRDTWLEIQGKSLTWFAEKIRNEINTVNADTRIGICACRTSFDLEGADIYELAEKLAGSTKPFVRLTGAPYWKQNFLAATAEEISLASIIECVRLQSHWSESSDIELISEGDSYPRPRFYVPASYMEGYDTALRASGGTHGIMKYMIDYNSKADYETGYIDMHKRNKPNYEQIAGLFDDKECCGLNIFEHMRNVQNRNYCDDTLFENTGWIPFASQKFLCDNSIPITYGAKNTASLVFGDNAEYITEEMMKNGLILDAYAARILMEKGIDVGIESYKKAPIPSSEFYCKEEECVVIGSETNYYNFKLKKSAEVLSRFIISPAGLATVVTSDLAQFEQFPACYLYENTDGMKFMVYSFVAELINRNNKWQLSVSKNYCRQRQLVCGVKWLQNRSLPAVCYNNPYLYMICKKNKNSMAVGIWNFSEDIVMSPKIELDGAYGCAEFYRCKGKTEGNGVKLTTDIYPYDFVFFTVK